MAKSACTLWLRRKAALFEGDLRDREGGKIKCGAARCSCWLWVKNQQFTTVQRRVDGLIDAHLAEGPSV